MSTYTSDPRGRIDVHHHFVPPAYARAMRRMGLCEGLGASQSEWSLDRSLALMDAHGIETAILSVSAPGVYFGDVEEARDLARACNEHGAEVRNRAPGRIGLFAVLPIPFTAPACAEAIHALDTLGADGVALLGSAEGRFLGDPAYADLMHELDVRRAVVFVHPNLHVTSRRLALDVPDFLLEFPCDTTRAAVNLILTGTIERFPRIRWILAHAGGFLPFVAWRAALLNELPGIKERAPRGFLAYVRRFFYDTALSPSPGSLATLRGLVGPSQILFGSDLPFVPEPLVSMEVESLETATGDPDGLGYGIARGHALRLFPRFGDGGTSGTGRASSRPEPRPERGRRFSKRHVPGPGGAGFGPGGRSGGPRPGGASRPSG